MRSEIVLRVNVPAVERSVRNLEVTGSNLSKSTQPFITHSVANNINAIEVDNSHHWLFVACA